ncbi:transcription repressor NadR [Pseudoflavonifractor hominis]|uniref:Transcription repressor NadR n=1 Tax=Pseudoflavonifractor hominis TaxID=2763059 RepID=A0ABR7HVV2_9FIRM|nr:transcription repressor NadR [Pseudoflavonifractor hominis]MBC5731561.1 transcription repressor NadR [Pseudoflavonifractor hominis]
MTGSERRKHIVDRIRQSEKPVSGTALAKECQVSRQVIVQDIALIRAAGYDILSTHRGYRLNEGQQVSRVFQVRHTDAQIEEELFTIVDLGGRVKNVMVDHQVYGQVRAPLRISSRRTASAFLEEIHSGKSSPLKHLTSDYHYHLIQADSEDTLDLIQEALHEKGFLISVAAEGEEGTACGDA